MYKPYKLSKLKKLMKEKLNTMLYIRGATLEDLFLESFEKKNKTNKKQNEIQQMVVKGRLQESQNNYLQNSIQYRKFLNKFTTSDNDNGSVLQNILLSLQMDEDAQLEEVDLEQINNIPPSNSQKSKPKLSKIHRMIREYSKFKFINKILKQHYIKICNKYNILMQDYNELQNRYNDEIEYRSKIEEQNNKEATFQSVSLLNSQQNHGNKTVQTKQVLKSSKQTKKKPYTNAVNDDKYNFANQQYIYQIPNHYKQDSIYQRQNYRSYSPSQNIKVIPQEKGMFTIQDRYQHEFVLNVKSGKLKIADYATKASQPYQQAPKTPNEIQIKEKYNSPQSINFTFTDISNVPHTMRLPPKEREQIFKNQQSKIYDYSLPGPSQIIPHLCRQSLLSDINKTDQTISSPSLGLMSRMSNSKLQYFENKQENNILEKNKDEESSSNIYNSQENDLVLEQRSNQQATVEQIEIKGIDQISPQVDLQNNFREYIQKEQSHISVKNTIEEMLNEQKNEETQECLSVEHISQKSQNAENQRSRSQDIQQEPEPLNSLEQKYFKAMELLDQQIDKMQIIKPNANKQNPQLENDKQLTQSSIKQSKEYESEKSSQEIVNARKSPSSTDKQAQHSTEACIDSNQQIIQTKSIENNINKSRSSSQKVVDSKSEKTSTELNKIKSDSSTTEKISDDVEIKSENISDN